MDLAFRGSGTNSCVWALSSERREMMREPDYQERSPRLFSGRAGLFRAASRGRVARIVALACVFAALVAVSIAQPASAVTVDLDWFTDIGTSNDASISVDDTVRWTLVGGATHTVESSSGPTSFASGFIQGAGTIFSYTFEEAGTWEYFCDVHGVGSMSGTITVTGGGVTHASKSRMASRSSSGRARRCSRMSRPQ